MSLILEALRKLEREKQAADRPGFVVLPAASWGEGRSRAGLLFGLVLLCAVFTALGIGLYMGALRTARVREQVAQPTPAAPQAPIDPLPAPSAAPATPGPATAATPTRPVPPYVEQPTTAAPAVAAPTSPAVSPTTSAVVEPELVADAAEGEPLAAPVTAATPAAPRRTGPSLVLTAIGARDGRAVAVIDDRLVHEGDEYDGWRVIAIGTDSVLVQYRGERRTLRFQ
ncbi:MAG: hypothetical protein NDJ94_12800 [Vicinamibacteria bacterium]|nr:hypothetical protein [Vicinamibacteria bacterium]